jgi:hypothetical protein
MHLKGINNRPKGFPVMLDSWSIKEGLRVLSSTVFLISFVESMKYLFLPVPHLHFSGHGIEAK